MENDLLLTLQEKERRMHETSTLLKNICFTYFFLTGLLLQAQISPFAWANSYGTNGVSDASVLTLDDSGNSYMAGTYGTGGITFGSITLSSSGSSENGFIVKFDPQGNALWAKRVRRVGGFQDSSNPDRLAIDNSGNVYVCGNYLNGAMIDTAVLPGDFGYFLAKFDASGNLQWTKTTQTLDSVHTYNSIHVNSQQEVIMTGLYNTMIQFSADHILTNPSPIGIAGFCVKYDGDGNVLSAVDLGVSNLISEPWAPYPTEYFRYDSADHIYRFVVETNSLMKYDGEGALLSSQTFGIGEHVFINDMTIGPNEALYFSGNFSNIFQFENESIESPWGPDITPVGFVSKINSEGLVDWTYTTTSQFPKYINKVKVDQIGSVYLQASAAYGGSMYYQSMIKLDSSGNLIWEEKFYNTNTEGNVVGGIIPRNIAQAQNGGNILMLGTFRNYIYFNETNIFSTTGNVWRIYLVQYGLCDMPSPEITAEAEAFCPGDRVEIAAMDNGTFLWSTGDTTLTLEATLPGNYFAFAVDSLGCYAVSNTVNITAHPVPLSPTLSATTLSFCMGSGATLSANENDNYLWSSGETDSTIYVTNAGLHFVQTTNEFGCSANSDTLETVVHPLPATVVQLIGNTLNSLEQNASYQWIACHENNTPIEGATLESYTPTLSGSYAVEVSNTFECSITTECISVVVANIDQAVAQREWSIYPNPATTHFFVNAAGDQVETTVLSIDGKVLLRTHQNLIHTAHLPAGIYLVSLTSDSRREVYRLTLNQ